jgi:hypothetical protein
MEIDLISVREIAAQHGKRKQTVFKILKRLGIKATKQRCATGNNQMVAYITHDDYRLVRSELVTIRSDDDSKDTEQNRIENAPEQGVFYLIQLEPQLDPGRFKVGFATSLPERIRHLRCSAPFATLVRSWPCKSLWEKTVIDSVSAGCERLHTEVFRALSLDEVAAKCEKFFAVMPPVSPGSNYMGNGPVQPSAASDRASKP